MKELLKYLRFFQFPGSAIDGYGNGASSLWQRLKPRFRLAVRRLVLGVRVSGVWLRERRDPLKVLCYTGLLLASSIGNTISFKYGWLPRRPAEGPTPFCVLIIPCQKRGTRLQLPFFRRMLDEMPNYGGFLSQLTSFIFIPIFGVLFLNRYLSGCLSEVSGERAAQRTHAIYRVFLSFP